MLGQPGLRRVIASDHLRPFGIHGGRIGWRSFEYFESDRQLDAAGASEREAFSQDGPVEAKHQIDNQLEPRAAARGSDMESAVAPSCQHGRSALHIAGRAANDDYRFA